MMVQENSESTQEPVKHGKYISQFLPEIITSIRRFEMIEIKYVDKGFL